MEKRFFEDQEKVKKCFALLEKFSIRYSSQSNLYFDYHQLHHGNTFSRKVFSVSFDSLATCKLSRYYLIVPRQKKSGIFCHDTWQLDLKCCIWVGACSARCKFSFL